MELTQYELDEMFWDDSNLLPCTLMTFNGLLEIKGITSVTVRPYVFSIDKGQAFSWDELLPHIILVMSKYLPADY